MKALASVSSQPSSGVSAFLRGISTGVGVRSAWHSAFHRQQERWSLIQFRDGSDNFYHSKHNITCERCNVSHTVKRIWPKFDADRNTGYQLTEARRKAMSLDPLRGGG